MTPEAFSFALAPRRLSTVDTACENLCTQDIDCYGLDEPMRECVESCISGWDNFRASASPDCFNRELDAAICESRLSCDELPSAEHYCGAEFDAADFACT